MDNRRLAPQGDINDADERAPLLRDLLPSKKNPGHATIDQEQWIKPRFFILIETGESSPTCTVGRHNRVLSKSC